jgi:AmmeMemoRadiSam system protein B
VLFWLHLLLFGSRTFSQVGEPDHLPYPSMFPDAEVFERAIESEQQKPPPNRRITGITVPHHLVAADLIARGFQLASAGTYSRIILLSPDHFKKSPLPFATTSRDFDTALGSVKTDADAVATLIRTCPLAGESNLFTAEHGIHAILPFIAHFFPDARIVPIALRIDSQPADWQVLAAALGPLVTPGTLIVQSTDFSHYLTYPQAAQRDQETMNVIASGDLDAVAHLDQPSHLDSKAAQYVHMLVERQVHHASPAVIGQRNSQGYTDYTQPRTTSYLLQVYESRPPEAVDSSAAWPLYPGEKVFFFAGDTFFGRYMAEKIKDAGEAQRIKDTILKITAGAPIIANLEGVTLDKVPPSLPSKTLGMGFATTMEWLRTLNIVAVSLANNHTLDFGAGAQDTMKQALRKEGIVAMSQGEVVDLGPFRLLALTDLSNRGPRTNELIDQFDFEALKSANVKLPLFAFVHWGEEFEPKAGPREDELTSRLTSASVGLIVGCHPHTGSDGIEVLAQRRATRAYSIGNFVFDQNDRRSDGALLEVRFFPEGTYAVRWHPVGNIYHRPQSR